MSERPTALIMGASSGLGRSLAELLAQKGFSLMLMARDLEDLEAIATDCRIRYRAIVTVQKIDLYHEGVDYPALGMAIQEKLGRIDYAYLVAGGSLDGDAGLAADEVFKKSMQLNYFSIMSFMKAILQQQSENKCRTILVVSSIATSAPRAKNVAYATAKMALETTAKSLRHYAAQQGLPTKIQVLKLGYMDSFFTRGQKMALPVASARSVAEFLYRQRDSDFGVRLFPRFWAGVVFILERLPWFIYKGLKF